VTATTPHRHFMTLALRLAAKGRGKTSPNPMVGALVVKNGRIVGRGYHHGPGHPHAEILALKQAGPRANGATLYVTLEPCPMCATAMVHARIARLVFGAWDPRQGAAGSAFDLTHARALNHTLDAFGGVLADECGALLKEFFRKRRG